MITTWRLEIIRALERNNEEWSDIVGRTDFDPDRRFLNGYGSPDTQSFRVYTKDWVYFSDEYDGYKKCNYIQRNPPKGKE